MQQAQQKSPVLRSDAPPTATAAFIEAFMCFMLSHQHIH
jgi:hypothetical protein